MFVRLEKKKISTKNPFCLALDAAAAPLLYERSGQDNQQNFGSDERNHEEAIRSTHKLEKNSNH